MNRRLISVALAGLLLGGGTTAAADGDATAGRQKAETCLGCHAVTGYYNVYPSYRVPKLGGQSAGYIESALKAYKAGTRQHDTMHANAENLSDQDMADIAAFMSSHGK
jgi:cytochrome c553